jgi:hypothetical protein
MTNYISSTSSSDKTYAIHPGDHCRGWSAATLEISAAIFNEDKDALRRLGYFNDADTLSMLDDGAGNHDMEFFWTNKSSKTYEQLQALYCSVMPSVLANKDNPELFAGYHHDRRTPNELPRQSFAVSTKLSRSHVASIPHHVHLTGSHVHFHVSCQLKLTSKATS